MIRSSARSSSWIRTAIGLLAMAEVLLLGGHALRWAWSSPHFLVREVVFDGHRTVDLQTLMRMASLKPGMNLFEVDLEAVRERVEMHPMIRKANVRRQPPQGVYVQIEERLPIALLQSGDPIGVDREGVVLGRLLSKPSTCLPLLEGLDLEEIRPGETLRDPGFHLTLETALHFARVPLLRKSCFSARRRKDGIILLRVPGGRLEFLVGEEGMERQIERFRSVANQIYNKFTDGTADRLELNFMFPGRIIVRSLDKDGGSNG